MTPIALETRDKHKYQSQRQNISLCTVIDGKLIVQKKLISARNLKFSPHICRERHWLVVDNFWSCVYKKKKIIFQQYWLRWICLFLSSELTFQSQDWPIKKSHISMCKVLKSNSRACEMKVLLIGFRLNGHTLC